MITALYDRIVKAVLRYDVTEKLTERDFPSLHNRDEHVVLRPPSKGDDDDDGLDWFTLRERDKARYGHVDPLFIDTLVGDGDDDDEKWRQFIVHRTR